MIAYIRAWAARYTEQGRYTPVGIAFHWVMAVLVVAQLGLGWYVGRMAAGGDKLHGYALHGNLGMLILLLALLRLLWRVAVPGPVNDADRLGWQTHVSRLVHVLFYVCFFLLPISGWLMWEALGDARPLQVAGIWAWPQLPFDGLAPGVQWWILDQAETIHHMLVILLVVAIVPHVGAALKHHFRDAHDVLEGMLPPVEAKPPARPHGAPPPAVRGASGGG